MQTWPEQPLVSPARCHACGRCIAACPHNVLVEDKQQVVAAYPELCNSCLACEEVCPHQAIEVAFAIVWGEPGLDRLDSA